MFYKLIKLSLLSAAISLLACGGAGAQDASNIDLSTDKAVLAEFQKIVDVEREQLGLGTGNRLEARDVCISRFKETQKIVVIGLFAQDGCRFEGAFIDSGYIKKTSKALSRGALAELGWEKATLKEREQLALLWVEKGMLAFMTVPQTRDRDFGNTDFQPPQAIGNKNETKVMLWVREASGGSPVKRFRYLEYTFAKDGSLMGF